MITEILDYLRSQCNLFCSMSFNDEIPKSDVNDVCAIRVLNGDRVSTLQGEMIYNTAFIQVFYRGTNDRAASLDIAQNISEHLHQLAGVNLTSTHVGFITATPPVFAFVDENQNVNYSFTIELEYDKK